MHWVLQQMATESKGITSELRALRSGKRLVRNCQSQHLIGKTIPLKVLSTFDKAFEKVWPINVSLRQCLHVRSLGLAQGIGLTRFTLSLFLVNFLLFTPKGKWQREWWQKTMLLEIQQISTRDKCDKYNQIIKASLKGSPRRQSHHALGSLIKSNCHWNLEVARKISKQEHSKPSGGVIYFWIRGFWFEQWRGYYYDLSGTFSNNSGCSLSKQKLHFRRIYCHAGEQLKPIFSESLKDIGARTPEIELLKWGTEGDWAEG